MIPCNTNTYDELSTTFHMQEVLSPITHRGLNPASQVANHLCTRHHRSQEPSSHLPNPPQPSTSTLPTKPCLPTSASPPPVAAELQATCNATARTSNPATTPRLTRRRAESKTSSTASANRTKESSSTSGNGRLK
jgi:hypothetical protein